MKRQLTQATKGFPQKRPHTLVIRKAMAESQFLQHKRLTISVPHTPAAPFSFKPKSRPTDYYSSRVRYALPAATSLNLAPGRAHWLPRWLPSLPIGHATFYFECVSTATQGWFLQGFEKEAWRGERVDGSGSREGVLSLEL